MTPSPRPPGCGRAYTEWAAGRHGQRRAAIEERLQLSQLAHSTRKPGQSLEDRILEIAGQRP